MKAQIYLADGLLVAECQDGILISNADAVQLADLLWAHGVASSDVSILDSHTDPDHAPMSGQKIAIYKRLRRYEQSGVIYNHNRKIVVADLNHITST